MSTFYESLGPGVYEALCATHLRDARTQVRQWVALLTRLGHPPPRRVLDVGCGLGDHTALWAAEGYDARGVDLSDAMLAAARTRHPSIEFTRADVCASDLDGADVVVTHFNFPMLFSPSSLTAVARGIRESVVDGGVWMTDFYVPPTPVEPFSHPTSLNGRDLLLVRRVVDGGAVHEWSEGGRLVCEERFFFHTPETLRALADAVGWRGVEIHSWRPGARLTPVLRRLWPPDARPWRRAWSTFVHRATGVFGGREADQQFLVVFQK